VTAESLFPPNGTALEAGVNEVVVPNAGAFV
jgi:hypothetical protein